MEENMKFPQKAKNRVAKMVKNLSTVREAWVWSLGWEDPWRGGWQPTPVFLPGESHGQRNLVGYSAWDHTKFSMTEATYFNYDPAIPLLGIYPDKNIIKN